MTHDTEPEVRHISEKSSAEGDLCWPRGESVLGGQGRGKEEPPTLSGHVPSSHSHRHGNDGRHVEVRRPHPLCLIRQNHQTEAGPTILFLLTTKISVSGISQYLTGEMLAVFEGTSTGHHECLSSSVELLSIFYRGRHIVVLVSLPFLLHSLK